MGGTGRATEMKKQKNHGVVHTPRRIVEFILNQAGFTGAEGGKIADPACGDGAFLVPVAERIILAATADGKRHIRKRLEGAEFFLAGWRIGRRFVL